MFPAVALMLVDPGPMPFRTPGIVGVLKPATLVFDEIQIT
jgi:hypothetical protein